MQQTRRYILDILREEGECTVDEMVTALQARIQHPITAVTVRHHLDILRGEGMVTAPAVRRSGTPGRPQYMYALTEKAHEQFPNNFQHLMDVFLQQIKDKLDGTQINVILEGVANHMIAEAQMPNPALRAIPIEARLEHMIRYMNQHGYEAQWKPCPEGFLIIAHNCPYHRLSQEHAELCGMDMRLIAGLIGVVPRTLGRISAEDDVCTYLLPMPHALAAD